MTQKVRSNLSLGKLQMVTITKLSEIEIGLNYHYQNVDLGLKFRLEASKPQNIPFSGSTNIENYQLCRNVYFHVFSYITTYYRI